MPNQSVEILYYFADTRNFNFVRLFEGNLPRREKIAVGVKLREETGALRIGREYFDDGLKVESRLIAIDRGALEIAQGCLKVNTAYCTPTTFD